MDALKFETLKAIEQIIMDAEDLTYVDITQDLGKEELIIKDRECERVTHMNCQMNSVGATVRQVCKHINNKTLFSYEEDYYVN